MKILILFASNSGSTYLVSQLIAETLEKYGYIAHIKKVKEATFNMLEDYDVLLLGSPSWLVNKKEGQPHEDMLVFMDTVGQMPDLRLPSKVAAFGCGDSSYLNFCNAVDMIETFLLEKNTKLVMPSLKIDSFFYDIHNNSEKTVAWATVLQEQLHK